MKLVYEIKDEAIELLKKIKQAGYAEFKDTYFRNVEEFKKSDTFGTPLYEDKVRDEAYFFRRNFCNLDEISELLAHDLLEDDDMSMSMTYVVSEKGKMLLSKLTEDSKEIFM